MKVMPFLKWVVAFGIVIVLFRAVNGAGYFSLYDLLVEFQEFEYGFDDFKRFVAYFADGEMQQYSYSWNYNLTGIEGFFTNVSNYFSSSWKIISDMTVLFTRTIFGTLVDFVLLLVKILQLVSDVLGFDTELITNDGWRGGR